MRRQARVALPVALIFLGLVLGVPLMNALVPGTNRVPVAGFPLPWFLLGIAFYPITWALSAWFVAASERLEAEDAAALRGSEPGR
jgi:hypothetical protein